MKYNHDAFKKAIMVEAVERTGAKILNSYNYFIEGLEYWTDKNTYSLWGSFQRFIGYHFTLELLKISMGIIDVEINDCVEIDKFKNKYSDDFPLDNIYPEIAEHFNKKFEKKITKFLFDFIGGRTCHILSEDSYKVRRFCQIIETSNPKLYEIQLDYGLDYTLDRIKTLSENIISIKY